MGEKKHVLTKWLYWFAFAVAVILVYKTVDNLGEIFIWIAGLFSVLMPFIIGILIAYLFYMPVKRLEKTYSKVKNKFLKKRIRVISIFTVYIIAIVLIILAINFIIPTIIESTKDLINNFQYYYNETITGLNNLPEDSFLKNEIIYKLVEQIKNIDLEKYVNFEQITQYAKGAINIVSSIFDIFVSVIVSVYILLERDKILGFLKNLAKIIFKENTYNNILDYFEKTNDIFFHFISSQLLDGIVVGIITAIAMSIMKIKYAVLLGFIIGLFNLIPYFGAIIAVIISIIITIFTGGFDQAVWMAIIVTILQQIDANIINPKITGNSLKISPLLVIFAVTVGGAYFGVLGMFLAVPVIAVLKLIIEDYIKMRQLRMEEKVDKGEL